MREWDSHKSTLPLRPVGSTQSHLVMPLPVGHTELAPAVENNQPASLHEKLLDSLFDGVYFVDLNRTITYWNQGAQDLTGYTPAEAVGRHCFDNFLAHVDES